jgi:hypothetical protein
MTGNTTDSNQPILGLAFQYDPDDELVYPRLAAGDAEVEIDLSP